MAAQMHCQPHNPAQAWMAGMPSFSSIAASRCWASLAWRLFCFAWYLLLCYPAKAFAQEWMANRHQASRAPVLSERGPFS